MTADQAKKVYHVDDGEEHWVVSTSREALEQQLKSYEIPAWEDEELTIVCLDDDHLLAIGFPDGLHEDDELPEGATVQREAAKPVRVIATCKAWADLHASGDLIASSVW